MDQDIKLSSDQLEAADARLRNAIREGQVASDMFDEGFCRLLGVNRTDGRCMDIIDRHRRLTAGQLAVEAGLTTGAVTALVDRLEAAGYVRRVRDETDRRKVWIEITEIAGEISALVFEHFKLTTPVIFSHFTPDQIDAITRFLEVGAALNRGHATLMSAHNEGAMNPEARLIQARAYREAALRRTGDILSRFAATGTAAE